jgi:hypothetical protein
MADKKKPECNGEDVVLMGPPLDKNGARPYVRHCSNCTTQAGVLKPVGEGEPLYDGSLMLEQRPKEPGAYNVVSTYQSEKAGPSRVTTEDYREGWDRIFGSPPPVGQA